MTLQSINPPLRPGQRVQCSQCGQMRETVRADRDTPQRYLCSSCAEPIRSVTILGRRWFQRTYGNTYHSAEVLINGQHVLNTGKHYGYDNQYIETALAAAEGANLIPPRERHEPAWQWAERHGIAFEARVADVSRERDL